MRTLIVIPARGGSKGIPNKNLAPCGGKPLIDWTLELLPHLDLPGYRYAVSTDSKEIANHCLRECIGIYAVARPARLATDKAGTVEVLQHALEMIGSDCDSVLCLQPTNPLRTQQDISAAYRLMVQTGVNSVISYVQDIAHGPIGTARRTCLKRTGEIYLTKRESIENGVIDSDPSAPYIIPRSRAWNIDEPCDIPIVEGLLRFNGRM